MQTNNTSAVRRRGVILPVVIAGAISSALLAFSMSPTSSALAASIQNTISSAGSGTLTMQEANATGAILCNSTDGGSVSTNNASCATINTYGDNLNMKPGETVTTNITVKNTGTLQATTFTLAGGTCIQAANGTVNGTATDLCGKINLLVKSGTVTIYTGTLTGFNTANVNVAALLTPVGVAPAATVPFSFAVTLDAAAGNAYQGLKVNQPMTFTFGA
jgi:hypothetical protein